MSRKKIILYVAIAAVACTTAWLLLRHHALRRGLSTMQGAVIRFDQDTRKELPIAGVVVTASNGAVTATATTDASGYFRIVFSQVIWPGQTMNLKFRNADYQPLDMHLSMTFRSTPRRLIVATMKPLPLHSTATPGQAPIVISNIRVRYTVNSEMDDNIGSAVQTFQVVNQANIPCKRRVPCSPDGDWKASSNSVTLDAGAGNRFQNARASCIAGPCPFTRINPITLAQDGRAMTVSALNWSDTATFLVEAEVFHAAVTPSVRQLYPVIYGRTLNFTLPGAEEGASIEADVNGVSMVFPLGPELSMSWATCSSRSNDHGKDSTVYRCELKPEYRF